MYIYIYFIISIKSFQVNYNTRLFYFKRFHNDALNGNKKVAICLPKQHFGINSPVDISAIKMPN